MSIALERTGDYLDELSGRLRRLGPLAAGLFVLVSGGYGYLQVAQADHYRQLAENNRLREARLQARRGLITDSHGRILVENVGKVAPKKHLEAGVAELMQLNIIQCLGTMLDSTYIFKPSFFFISSPILYTHLTIFLSSLPQYFYNFNLAVVF